jgi:hypothetical protein
MDFPFDFSVQKVAMVIEVRGSIAQSIFKINDRVECELIDPSDGVARPQTSREPTPTTTTTDESVVYIKLPMKP